MHKWFSPFWLRTRALWKRRQLDRDLHDELAFHLAMKEARLREAMRPGLVPNEVGYIARRQFGNLTQIEEKTRMLWSFRWLEQLGQDVRYALRSMRKSPALSAVIVLSLALGIGANTAIFSLMNAVMLRMLPVNHPEELMLLERRMDAGRSSNRFTYPLYEAIRDRQGVFSGLFAWSMAQFDMANGGEVKNADGMWVSGNYFASLGVRPEAGRLLVQADDQRGCASLAVLSYRFWQERFGGAESAIGQTISLNKQPFQVIGVADRRFTGTEVGGKFDLATPICATRVFDGKESRLERRSWWWLFVAGRKKEGFTDNQVRSRLEVLSPAITAASVPQKWVAEDRERFLKTKISAIPSATGVSTLREQFAQPLTILMLIVGAVLLIACANIASLVLARSSARRKELAIRKAVGASRGRLVRQLLTESVVLSAAGAALGLLFARWGSALLVRNISVGHNHVFLDLALDKRVFAFTAILAVFTGVLVGLLPALRSTRVPLMAAMKGGRAADVEQAPRFHPGKWIVAGQVALSLVLVVSGGLLLRSFEKLMTVNAGFDRKNVLLVQASMDRTRFSRAERDSINQQIEARLAAVPGVVAAAHSFTTPLKGWEWNNLIHSEWESAPTGEQSLTFFNAVTPNYFQALGMRLLAGRTLNDRDTKSSPQVAVVNETMARRFFANGAAVGKHFRIEADPGEPSPLIEVVGIVNDAKYESLREETFPTAFFPVAQAGNRVGADGFILKTSVPPLSLAPAVQQAVGEVNKAVSIEFRTLQQQVDDNLVQERLLATLSGFFGGLALLLAMIGLYGVLSYLVTQRQTEFGIRMALGARPGSILRLVMNDTLLVLAGGVAAGIAISLATVRLLEKMLFGLTPHDSVTMLLAVGLLSAVGVIAGFLPARRATRVDPMVALRYE